MFVALRTASASSYPDIPATYFGFPFSKREAIPEAINHPKNSSASNPKSQIA